MMRPGVSGVRERAAAMCYGADEGRCEKIDHGTEAREEGEGGQEEGKGAAEDRGEERQAGGGVRAR